MLYIFNFFTTWVVTLTVFHNYVEKYIALSFLAYIVMIVGLYFSYVNPRKFTIQMDDDQKIVVKDPHKFFLIDLPFHILMFFFVYTVYGLHNKLDIKIVTAVFLIALYAIIFNPAEIYEVHMVEIIIVSLCAMISYVVLCKCIM